MSACFIRLWMPLHAKMAMAIYCFDDAVWCRRANPESFGYTFYRLVMTGIDTVYAT